MERLHGKMIRTPVERCEHLRRDTYEVERAGVCHGAIPDPIVVLIEAGQQAAVRMATLFANAPALARAEIPTAVNGAARFHVRTAAMLIFVCGLVSTAAPASAADAITLSIRDHRFTPTELTVPAGERFRIEVQNQDVTPAEFESSDLKVEKIIVPGGKITVMAGPLKPGTYKIFDDYHPDTATGTIAAVEQKTEK